MPRVEIAESPTFETDDKRAQYARLAVWNHAINLDIIKKTVSVNSISEANLEKAWKDLTGGNYLEGPDGIETIMRLTKNGAEDTRVVERGLTKAYAQEVRPFIRRGLLSPYFGRRNKRKTDKDYEVAKAEVADLLEKAEAASKPAPKKRTARPRAKSTKMVEAIIKHEKSVI